MAEIDDRAFGTLGFVRLEMGSGWLKIHSSTYILGMCEKHLPYPLAEYDQVYVPNHPKLLDLFEAAFVLRGNSSAPTSDR